MKIENCKLKISKKAFTLIEILVAIAIVGILAAVVLVSMSSYGKKARASKALASLSSAIPNIISCLGNSGTVKDPSGGNNICSLDSKTSHNYGVWPVVGGDLANYSYDSFAVGGSLGGIADIKNWVFAMHSDDSHDNVKICCNSAMNSCKILSPASSTCSKTDPSS